MRFRYGGLAYYSCSEQKLTEDLVKLLQGSCNSTWIYEPSVYDYDDYNLTFSNVVCDSKYDAKTIHAALSLVKAGANLKELYDPANVLFGSSQLGYFYNPKEDDYFDVIRDIISIADLTEFYIDDFYYLILQHTPLRGNKHSRSFQNMEAFSRLLEKYDNNMQLNRGGDREDIKSIVDLLLERGVKINREYSALSNFDIMFLAAEIGDLKLLKLLISLSFPLNVNNQLGQNLLEVAVQNHSGNQAMVSFLISKGLKPLSNLVNISIDKNKLLPCTEIEIASESEHTEVVCKTKMGGFFKISKFNSLWSRNDLIALEDLGEKGKIWVANVGGAINKDSAHSECYKLGLRLPILAEYELAEHRGLREAFQGSLAGKQYWIAFVSNMYGGSTGSTIAEHISSKKLTSDFLCVGNKELN